MEKYSHRSGNKTDNQIVNAKTVNHKGLLFFLCPKKTERRTHGRRKKRNTSTIQ